MVNPLKITFVTTEPHVAYVLSEAAKGMQSSLASCEKNISQVWKMYSVENSISERCIWSKLCGLLGTSERDRKLSYHHN